MSRPTLSATRTIWARGSLDDPASGEGERPAGAAKRGRAWEATWPSGWSLSRRLLVVATFVALAAALAIVAALPVVPPGHGGGGSPNTPGNSSGPSPPSGGPTPTPAPVTGAAVACNAIGDTPTPSALLIPLPNPTSPLAAGGRATVSYEVEVVTMNASDRSATLYLPSLFGFFPVSGGAPLTLYFAPTNLTISESGWLGPYRATSTVAGTTAFSSAEATFTSEKIALMSSLDYGNLSIALRWQWTMAAPGGASTSSAWSVPTAGSNWPSATPSSFLPAAHVALVRSPAEPAQIGSSLTVWLAGFSDVRSFGLEVEFPANGSPVRFQANQAPAGNLAPFSASIVLLNYDGYLSPGAYLLHVHDACGALLYSLPVTAEFAPSANITFTIAPASCGAIEFDGSYYGSGATATVTPSQTPYSLQLPSCAGWTFSDWSTTGGLHVTGSDTLLVSASGTFTATYRQ